ncbi:MAG: SEC-C domain-containing protein, partial [Candidatus Omnitrophica bacterium]|nr:SEC-C domain-containing protein [Candidatus Omnitrophota bacterium]
PTLRMKSVFGSTPQNFVHDDAQGLENVARSVGSDETSGQPRSKFSPSEPPPKAVPVTKQGPKVGRNDPCPCGSGKKHKKCCGQ